jgi:N-acetylneuraminate synthase/N,N'-diacetyllegionaminate synthase
VQIFDTDISPGEQAYFIAEAGVNPNGDIEMAKRLIDVAADCGADAVKFQTFSADRLVTRAAAKAEYQKKTTDGSSQHEMLKYLGLGREDHEALIKYCAELNVTFLSTPFDTESADLLDELERPAIKIGSGELDNHPFLKHVAEFARPMIVSTGMGTMEEVHAAREAIRTVAPDIDLAFLHCTSEYPADVADVNLRAMEKMADELEEPVGYSDHTTLVETPALAVVTGACIIEKHFTLDSSLPGPDHEASLEPDELKRAVELVRTATQARGNSEKRPTSAEEKNKMTVRKSLHAANQIPSGTVLTESHVKIVRPANGISPTRYEDVLGSTTINHLSLDDPITDSDLEAQT